MGSGLVLGVLFDLVGVFAMLDAERTRVEVPSPLGESYVFYCKPGPAGETPVEQGERAYRALETNLVSFGEVLLDDAATGTEAGRSDLAMGLQLIRKSDGWLQAITQHLEATYGCVWAS